MRWGRHKITFWQGYQFGGWLLGLLALIVYCLTLEPSISFWDCGEFIATSQGLQVGHPPGAPVYQLLAHCLMFLSFGNTSLLAWWSNLLSALAGAATVMFLFWSIVRLCLKFSTEQKTSRTYLLAGAVGAMVYMVCDTAWFSTVESEVYSLSMLFSSAVLWAMLRWDACTSRPQASRWLLLVALLTGLSVCVHLLTLLVMPALLLLFILSKHNEWKQLLRLLPLLLIFFVMGLSPYVIIPIRANANPPINEGNPATAQQFKDYITRKQYEHAPLFPRMWRNHPNDAQYYADWSRRGGEAEFYFTYQLGYMYLRYFMWNFAGRYNDSQGFGSLQNGQFITGIPIIDKQLVGTAATPPNTLPTAGRHTYYLLPLLLGILGLLHHRSHHRSGYWVVLTIFLFGGVILSLYLNHPAYEPRERDYAYILSFYAFSIWVGMGVCSLAKGFQQLTKPSQPRLAKVLQPLPLLTLAVPMLMACQNWDNHNRSGRMIAHDVACNILNSCEPNAILFTLGDNETFPLWGVQETEGVRNDVTVLNISLIGGSRNMLYLMSQTNRPVYLAHYAKERYKPMFTNRLQAEGYTYHVMQHPCDSIAIEPFLSHCQQSIKWNNMSNVYVDEISRRMLLIYWHNIIALSENLLTQADTAACTALLQESEAAVPLAVLKDPTVAYQVTALYRQAGKEALYQQHKQRLQQVLQQELDYYHTLSPRQQSYIAYSIQPREQALQQLSEL